MLTRYKIIQELIIFKNKIIINKIIKIIIKYVLECLSLKVEIFSFIVYIKLKKLYQI
jgi:hypothetical protein